MSEEQMKEYENKLTELRAKQIALSANPTVEGLVSLRAEYIEIGAVSNSASIGRQIEGMAFPPEYTRFENATTRTAVFN